MGQDWDYGPQPTVYLSLVTSLRLHVTATANHMRCVIFAYNTPNHMTRPTVNPLDDSLVPGPDTQGARIMLTLYACIMTRWHQNASRVAGPLYGESTYDRWIPNIGTIMLNFDVVCVVNQNKLLRNTRIAGDMRRPDSCDTTVLEVPQQINGPYHHHP